MDPFLAHTLHSGTRHGTSRSTIRNPDDLFPERDMSGPDPVALWMVNAATVSGEWLGDRSARVRSGWRQILGGWALILRRLARITH